MDPRRIFDSAFDTETLIAAGVFAAVVVTLLAAVALSRRRRRRGEPASQRTERTRLELLYVLAVAAVAGFVVYLSFSSTGDENTSSAASPRTRIDITAFRWCWRFQYPGAARTVTNPCDAGHPPTMVVPVGTPVAIRIRSADVIHSWWVPALRYKMDAFPHHTNTFTLTIDRTGRWPGRCAEFCGPGHTIMDFYLRAVSPQRYQQWLAGGGNSLS